MTKSTMTLLEYLRKVGVDPEGDFLREGAQLLAQLAIELEAEEVIGAGRYERSPNRKNHRNGYRDRMWETRVGEIPLRIPKLREGNYFKRPRQGKKPRARSGIPIKRRRWESPALACQGTHE